MSARAATNLAFSGLPEMGSEIGSRPREGVNFFLAGKIACQRMTAA